MGTFRYTVTTLTTRCPHCGYTLDEETHGALTPIISCLWFITFPILIPYAIIKYWGLGDPDMPKIGPKTITCPHCSLPVKTNNLEVEDLEPEALVTYRFRIWFYVSYVLGAILSFTLLYLLIDGLPIVSGGGLIALLAFLSIITIVITYRVKLAKCNAPKPQEVIIQNKPVIKSAEKNTQESNNYFYCRKCGNKLPADSQFCDKCGTEIVK